MTKAMWAFFIGFGWMGGASVFAYYFGKFCGRLVVRGDQEELRKQ